MSSQTMCRSSQRRSTVSSEDRASFAISEECNRNEGVCADGQWFALFADSSSDSPPLPSRDSALASTARYIRFVFPLGDTQLLSLRSRTRDTATTANMVDIAPEGDFATPAATSHLLELPGGKHCLLKWEMYR